MTDCILHIGLEKTGSTSLQSALAGNRDRLAAAGVLYPRALGERSHVKAYVFASEGGPDELKAHWGLRHADDLDRFRADCAGDLRDEIAGGSPRLLCISNEHCSSRLSRPSEIQRLASLIAEFCARTTVVVYLRAQGDALRSAYSTYVRTGGREAFRYPSPDEIARLYDYRAVLRRWADVFGQSNLDVRLYDRRRRDDFDVVADFIPSLGGDLDPDDFIRDRDQNASLGVAAIALLRRLNGLVPYARDGRLDPLRGNLHDLIGEFTGDCPFEGDPAVIQALDDAMSEANESIRRDFFPRLPAPLFASRPHRGPSTAGLAEPAAETGLDAAARLAAHLWIAKQAQVLDLRDRLDRLRRRDAGRQDP